MSCESPENGGKGDRVSPAGKAPLGAIVRVVQVILGLELAYWMVFAAFTEGADFPYDLRDWSILFLVTVSALCIWLLQQRVRSAKPVAVMTMFANAAFWGACVFLPPISAYSPALAVFAGGFLAMGMYFLFSKRMATVLTGTLVLNRTDEKASGACIEDDATRPWRSWGWWRNVALFFCAFTIIGHWAEMGFCQLIRLGVVAGDYNPADHVLWQEWLYPYVPEGIAVALIVMVLYPLKDWLLKRCGGHHLPAIVLSFLATTFVCTSIDFITGILYNADYSLWDYTDMPFNFMGQICLQNSLIYGTAATIVLWTVYPLVARLIHRHSEAVMNTVFVGVAAFYAFLWMLYMVNV